VCAPYFVNLNNSTFRLKRYYSLFIYVHSKREQKSHLQLSNLQCCHFGTVIFRVAIISNVLNVRLQRRHRRQTMPPLVDGVVHNRLVQFAPHGDQTLVQLVDVLVISKQMHACFVHFSAFGTAKIIEIG